MTGVDTSAAEVERLAAVLDDDDPYMAALLRALAGERDRLRRENHALTEGYKEAARRMQRAEAERDAAAGVCEALEYYLKAFGQTDRTIAWGAVLDALNAWRAARGGGDVG